MYEELKEKYPEIEIGKSQNLSNQIFGKWQALYRTSNKGRKIMWVCKCSCDKHTIKPVWAVSLRNGTSTSCGCLRRDTIDKKIRIRDKYGNIQSKKCSRCKEIFPISEFYKNSRQLDGYSNICKQCEIKSKESRFNAYKKSAKARNIEFNLSKEEFYKLTYKPCFYCGEFNQTDAEGNRYNGIDRLDSKGGYEIRNVVPCCVICNRMKLDYSYNFFLEHIKKVIRYRGAS